MPKGVVRLIRCLPNAASRRRVLLNAGPASFNVVSTFSERLGAGIARMAVETGAGEFVAFSDLVGRSMEWCDQPRGLSIASDREEAEAVAAASRNLPEEGPFVASSGFPGFHRRLRATLAELRLWGMGSDNLRELSLNASPTLSAKLHSLAEVEVSLRSALESLGKSLLEYRIRKCLESEGSPGAKPGTMLIFAGSEDAPLFLDWVEWAVKQGAAVTLAVDGHPGVPALFEGASRIAGCFGKPSATVAEGNSLCLNLFTDQPAMAGEFRAEVFSAADPLAEVEWALRRASGAAADGTAYADLVLFCRNSGEYLPLIESSAARLEVPIRCARRVALDASAICRLLLAATSAALLDDPAPLLSVAASTYLPASPQSRAAVAATLASDASSPHQEVGPGRLEALVRLAASRPDLDWLSEILEWQRSAPKRAPLSEWAAWWRGCLNFGWIKAARQTPSETQSRDDAALAALEEVLLTRASIAAAYGRSDLGPREAAASVGEILDTEEFVVPPAQKGLLVAHNSDELPSAAHVLVLGMLEGSFPRRRSESPILSDFEREEIGALCSGRPALPDSHRRARSERDEFLKACAAASQSITFSYPQTGDDRDNVPAFYLEEVERAMAGGLVKTDHPRLDLTPEIDHCIHRADRALRSALDTPSRSGPPNQLFTEPAVAALKPIPEEALSPGELRDALLCGFRSAFRRRLSLKALHAESKWNVLRTIPQHASLPAIATPDEALRALSASLETTLAELAGQVSAADLRLLRSGGKRLIREWVEREFQARALWPKDPGSTRVHAAFGNPGLRGEIPLKERTLRLRGAVTAVASMGLYAVAGLMNARRQLAETPNAEALAEADAMELGLYLLAQWGEKPAVAVEAESLSGDRTLFVLPRRADQDVAGMASQGMRVVDLGEPRDFFPKVKESLGKALARIDGASVEASPGDHCTYCDFAEICRSAPGLSEEEAAFERTESKD